MFGETWLSLAQLSSPFGQKKCAAGSWHPQFLAEIKTLFGTQQKSAAGSWRPQFLGFKSKCAFGLVQKNAKGSWRPQVLGFK